MIGLHNKSGVITSHVSELVSHKNSVTFVENYYPFILFGIGSYLGARYVNELKQTLS